MAGLDIPTDGSLSDNYATIPDVSVDAIASRVLSRQINAYAGSKFAAKKIATILTPTHTISNADFASGNASVDLSYPHGLDYEPSVDGSFSSTFDNSKRQIPYFYQSPESNYYGFGKDISAGDIFVASASVQIFSIDKINININMRIFDFLGLSWLSSNGVLSFKLICYEEPIVS